MNPDRAPNPAGESPSTNAGLPRGTLLPSVSLASAPDGELVELRGGRGPRVLILVHAGTCHGCQDFLRQIAVVATRVAEWGGRLSLVLPDAAEDDGAWLREAPPGTRVLSDPERTVARHLGLTGAAVVIADEWGEIYFVAQSGTGHQLPLPEEIVSWVRFIAIQCPECEQPEGEWRTLD
jgi:peroxiredoxin